MVDLVGRHLAVWYADGKGVATASDRLIKMQTARAGLRRLNGPGAGHSGPAVNALKGLVYVFNMLSKLVADDNFIPALRPHSIGRADSGLARF